MCKSESRIEVAALKTKYPQGAERSLIYAVTGRAINSSMLPADAGCIVDNVATAIARGFYSGFLLLCIAAGMALSILIFGINNFY